MSDKNQNTYVARKEFYSAIGAILTLLCLVVIAGMSDNKFYSLILVIIMVVCQLICMRRCRNISGFDKKQQSVTEN